MDSSMEDQQPHTSRHHSSNCESEDNVSEISNLSGLEDSQEARWRPNQGPLAWIQLQMLSGTDPRTILKDLLPSGMMIPDDVDPMTLWRIVVSILSEPPRRKKLKHVNTIDNAVGLIQKCQKIIVLTGAGISVSCGIPDFRSKDGIYAKLAKDYPDLSEPQDMFDINFFTKNPKPFFKFASEIYPGKFIPSVSHKFIKHIEDNRKLLRNYTQNIDTLEQCAGIKNVIQCHGSFATARCMVCRHQVQSDDIKDSIMNQQIPRCGKCSNEDERAVMKPDIVFFGEGLPEEFHMQMESDKDQCDLLIVIGSSLKVRPVALIPNSVPADIPQILINREPLRHMTFDVELLGNCDVIVQTLARRLGWSALYSEDDEALAETGAECLMEESAKNAEAERQAKQATEDDEGTRDSFIENMQDCHLCLGTSSECTHKSTDTNSTPDNDVTTAMKTEEVSMDGEAGEPSSNMEKVSHDLDLAGTSRIPEVRRSLAEKLPEGTYAFLPPNRYLFPGGELMHYNTNGDSDDSDSLDSNSDDDSPDEQHQHQEDRTETEKPSESETEIENGGTTFADKSP